MPIEVVDSDDGLGAIIVGRGTLTEREYLDTMKAHLSQPEDKFRKYRYGLSDYSGVTQADVPSRAVELIARRCVKAANVNPDVIVALVAEKAVVFGLTRMWELLVEETAWETMAFRSRDDAEDWIRIRMSEKYGIDDLTLR